MGEIEASRIIFALVYLVLMHSKYDMYIISHTRDSPAIGIQPEYELMDATFHDITGQGKDAT